jgi:hypothetical protein
MCIATVVKLKDCSIITFTRDESEQRIFEMPKIHSDNLFYPKDLFGNGSWIGHNFKIIYFLQNGALQKHKRQTPYSISRGQLLLNALKGQSLESIVEGFKNEHVEPFTLTGFNINSGNLNRLIFDGQESKIEEFDSFDQYIFLSSTLYNEDMKEKISNLFYELDFTSSEELLNFHLNHCIGTKDGLQLTQVCSSSLTQFIIFNKQLDAKFINRLNSETKDYHWDL